MTEGLPSYRVDGDLRSAQWLGQETGRNAGKPMTHSQAQIIAAHRHSIRHRDEILTSEVCGCFYCLAVFPPSEIKEWVDTKDSIGQTALCPKCDIDSVIGSNSGYPIEPEFLAQMRKHWCCNGYHGEDQTEV